MIALPSQEFVRSLILEAADGEHALDEISALELAANLWHHFRVEVPPEMLVGAVRTDRVHAAVVAQLLTIDAAGPLDCDSGT